MDVQFAIHNTHITTPEEFGTRDPHLLELTKATYIFKSALIDELPTETPGIYTLGGGRQIGKTTLLKQWMHQLLEQGVNPNALFFMSGEIIRDQHALLKLIMNQLKTMPQDSIHYFLIDEVTYIKDWDKGIKYGVDGGLLRNAIVLLTGSDLGLIKEIRKRLPGRRGQARKTDFHYYPLSFYEFVSLVEKNRATPPSDKLDQYFKQYLIHGGFITAINDYYQHHSITPATLTTYYDWVIGDILKRGKQEHYLNEILHAIIKNYSSQVTWNSLSHDLSIDHPKTVQDYVTLLSDMDAVFIQAALMEHKLVGAPKKARKLYFNDPFIYHAILAGLKPKDEPFTEQIKVNLEDISICSRIVEATVVTHFRRYYPTYYIKAEGEIDIAYVDKNTFYPVEVKWTSQLRPKDAKLIRKYKNGVILTRTPSGPIHQLKTEAISHALFSLSAHKR